MRIRGSLFLSRSFSLSLSLLAAAGCSSTPKLVAKRVEPLTSAPAPAVNPFVGAKLYVNSDYAKKIEAIAARTPAMAEPLKKFAALPTAVWLDTIEMANAVTRYLDDAVAQQGNGAEPVLPVFVVYDLPDRDCSAEASNGELTLKDNGEARYQQQYIDVIAAQFAAHPKQRIVAVLEPDSLANVATNLAVEKCAGAAEAYKRSVAYAIAKLSLPNVFLYVDAAHAGWLGWRRNLVKIAAVFKEVLAMAGGAERIRGFAVNVSNYNPVRDESARRGDPNDPGPDELTYVDDLAKALAEVGIKDKGYLIDTSRNGRANIRTSNSNWCNIKGAGLGERPRAAPAPHIDAFYWIKVPGESDGIADPKAARFDPNCASDDATPGAPQAGKLFESYMLDLVKNANPPL